MLKNKVIVITGGAGLIGQAFAQAVIQNEGIAIVADIDEEKLATVKQQLRSSGNDVKVESLVMDMTNKDSINSAIELLHEQYGKIDALVNNAYPRNKNYGKHFFDIEYADFVDNVGMNIGGYFLASQQFSQYFKKQGAGNIINIASIYGVVAPKFDIYDATPMTMPAEYAVIKSGLIHLTKYMANYLKGNNIRVNAISPGGIANEQPTTFQKAYQRNCLNKGMLDAKDLQGTLVYLLSDMSQYVNGQNIIVDDGFCL